MEFPADQDAPLAGVSALARDLAGLRPPVLLDVRWQLGGPPGLGDYQAGHLPGARYVDLDRELSGPPGRAGRHPLPAPEAFQVAMRRAGVRGGWPVVLYDESTAMAAARGWWLLRYFGHRQVRVLDGGYRAWVAAGEPVERGDGTSSEPGDFTAHAGHMPVLDAEGAAALARVGVLLDARAPERYRGESEPLDPVAGHIPGALSAPTAGNLSGDGRFLAAAELRSRFAALLAGLADGRPAAAGVGSYCGSGITAAHEVLALEIAGVPAALYPGSWSNWAADPARPVAIGPDPG